MKHSLFATAPLAFCLIRAASLLLPRAERSPWLAEWTAELWHLCRAHTCETAASIDVRGAAFEFSLGAFPDALWLRRNQVAAMAPALLCRGSAARCGLGLTVGTAVALLICLSLPNARRAMLSSFCRDARGVVLISGTGYEGVQTPSIPAAEYREWKANAGHLFLQLAWYRPVFKGVYLAHHETVHLSMVLASANLMRTLGASPLVSAAGPGATGAQLLLSHSAWQRFYGSDSHLVGSTAIIAGVPVRIAGVLADDRWPLPERMDAWLLEDDATMARISANARGFVLARLREQAFPGARGSRHWFIETRGKTTHRFDCINFTEIARQPLSVFLFALLLASMALPATTALPLGDYPAHQGRLSHAAQVRRWAFFVVKLVLLLSIVYLGSIDLAYGFGPVRSSTSLYVELGVAFPGLLFAFRWTLQDQRRRCPVCLRLLSNPARVGQASCNFLAWNGTELFCSRGHGLLHIPELPTSWFSRQRWLCLDPSWLPLFAETSSASLI